MIFSTPLTIVLLALMLIALGICAWLYITFPRPPGPRGDCPGQMRLPYYHRRPEPVSYRLDCFGRIHRVAA